MLSAFHVTTLTDGVAGSLRDALARANSHAGADIITFQPGLTGTIPLTGDELTISDDLTIDGPGADKLTVSGNNTSRVFKVESGEAVRISGLTIAGGYAGGDNGGGIENDGAATGTDSTFTDNSAVNGGEVFNATIVVGTRVFPGMLMISGSTFTGNSASFSGGIDNSGTATVSGSTFTMNTASPGNGGLNNESGAILTQFDNQFLDDQPRDVFL